jgi:hypothetical protein
VQRQAKNMDNANERLFLVTSIVTRTPYMERDHKSEEKDIVWAVSADEARAKTELFYEAKTSEYNVYYSCSVEDVREAIR